MTQLAKNRMGSLVSNDYVVKSLAELPTPFQMAIIWYMAVEGDAWDKVDLFNIDEDNFKSCFNSFLPKFIEIYGDRKLGIAYLNADRICDSVMEDPEIAEDFSYWDEYHAWYTSGSIPNHPDNDLWPVILSDDDSETIHDGWHRFHSYIRKNTTHIPAVFFMPKD